MAALPFVALPTGSVSIGDGSVACRGLSRSEVIKFRSFDDPTEREVYLIEVGAQVSHDEAVKWFEATDSETVTLVIEKVLILSGLLVAKPAKGKAGKDPQP